jgi:hypothetical protein
VFSCAQCAEDVRTTAVFLDDARAYVAPSAGADRRPSGVVPFDRSRRARSLRSLFWPLPAGAAAAAALLVAVAGYQTIHVAGLRRELTSEQRLQAVPSYFVAVSRSEGPTIVASSRHRRIALRFSQSFERSFPFYRCGIRDAGGRVVTSDVLEAPASGDELEVLIPADGLTSGAYTVNLTGLESAAATTSPVEPAHYQFTLRRER